MPDLTHFKLGRGIWNFQPGRSWYRITAKADGPSLVSIFDEIGWLGVTAQDFVSEMSALDGDIELHLNSPGGEVFDGLAIYNSLVSRKGTVSVVVDSLAASIASVIAQAASPGKLSIARNASMMIHEAQGMAGGSSAEMTKMAAVLDKQSDNIAGVYAERTGKTAAHWRDLMRDESWFSGPEAVDAGLADGLLAGREPATTNSLAAPVITASWDGPAAMARASAAKNPAAAFASICAGEHTTPADKSLRKHWSLPHHDNQGGPANPDGVRAALAKFPRVKRFANPDAAKAHLVAHMKAINPDYDPGNTLDTRVSSAWDDPDAIQAAFFGWKE